MTGVELYVLVFLAPYGQPYYSADPPLVLPRAQCLAEAERRNGKQRRVEFYCEVRS
jgi:hypothetical protein